jgi:hypothetical protein
MVMILLKTNVIFQLPPKKEEEEITINTKVISTLKKKENQLKTRDSKVLLRYKN